MEDTENVSWESPIRRDFVEIDQFIHDFHTYLVESEGTEDGIYELVRKRLSVIGIKDIIPMLVAVILSKEETQDLGMKNLSLQWEVSRLVYELLSTEKRVDLLNPYEWILEVSIDGTILAVNDFMVEHSGYSRQELVGSNMKIMGSGNHTQEFWHNFWTTIKSGKVWAGDICNKKKDGSLLWLWTLVIPKIDDQGNVLSFKVVRHDISEVYALQKKLKEVMDTKIDALTGLPNRERCLEDFRMEKNRSVALLHINNMFDINSVFGRDIGNRIIQKVGKMLRKFSLSNNVDVYRFEGMEFAIVFQEGMSEEYIREQYERINKIKIFDSNNRIYLSFSLWVALNEPNIETLLKNGYLALKESRNARKYVVFNEENHTIKESEEFFRMRNLVREAFKEDLFEVHFQEIKENSCCTKKTGKRKFECLVRMWDSKEKTNLLPPWRFLWAVKQDGKNEALTSCIIEKVCKFMTENEGDYSINLTEEDLSSDDFVNRLHKKIDAHSIDRKRFTFEILEEIEDMDSKNIRENIRNLRKYFGIAIDDFWSGYSNFSRMLEIEPTSLKIDMRYVRGIDTNNRHRSLVRAIVGLAHDNGMTVVAEGVETEKEQLVLESLWVDYSQGFLFNKPKSTI